MLVLGTNNQDLFVFLFHGLQASTKWRIHATILRVARVLNITLLPRPAPISNYDNSCSLSQKCQKYNLCYHTYLISTGILTCFPFPNIRIMNSVRIDLPLTDLHCQGTLALSVTVILTLLCSYFHQDFHCNQIHASSWTRFSSGNTPAYRTHY